MNAQPFGITVQHAHTEAQINANPWPEWTKQAPAGWEVSLPHSCDRWMIVEAAPLGEAIDAFGAFISEAIEAYKHLAGGREFGTEATR